MQLNVQLKLSLKVQSILKLMLMHALTVELALTPVLQKQSIQLNNFIHNNKKAAASAVAFFCSSLFFLYAVPVFSFSLFFGGQGGKRQCKEYTTDGSGKGR